MMSIGGCGSGGHGGGLLLYPPLSGDMMSIGSDGSGEHGGGLFLYPSSGKMMSIGSGGAAGLLYLLSGNIIGNTFGGYVIKPVGTVAALAAAAAAAAAEAAAAERRRWQKFFSSIDNSCDGQGIQCKGYLHNLDLFPT